MDYNMNNNNIYITFCVSGDMFCGIKFDLAINNFNDMDEIIVEFTNRLKSYILSLRKEQEEWSEFLLEKFRMTKFHFHQYKFEDLLKNENRNNIFYICTHC